MNKYRPTVVKEAGAKGDSGIADLTWGETKLKIDFQDGETYKVMLDELPEYCQNWNFMETAFVTMKGDNESVLGIRPMQGVFTGKFLQIAVRNEDDPPAPTTYNGKYGPYDAFTALLEVTKGKYNGTIYPLFLAYKFIEVDELVAIKGEGKSSEKLMDFLDCAGAWEEGELAYSDNVLPALQKRMKHAKKTFQWVAKNGYVESVMEADFEEDDEPKKKAEKDEVDDEEEKPKSKKHEEVEETPKKKSFKDKDEFDE